MQQLCYGIADSSISYDDKVTEKMNVGVRPFYRLTLGDVSSGRMGLQSKGRAVRLSFSLKKEVSFKIE